jgi:hypothetical protein
MVPIFDDRLVKRAGLFEATGSLFPLLLGHMRCGGESLVFGSHVSLSSFLVLQQTLLDVALRQKVILQQVLKLFLAKSSTV